MTIRWRCPPPIHFCPKWRILNLIIWKFSVGLNLNYWLGKTSCNQNQSKNKSLNGFVNQSYPKEKTDFEKYYRGYINGRFLRHTQHYYDHNLNPVLKIIKDQHPKQLRVLEVGSGCGTESLYLALFGCRVIAVELLKKYVDV